MTIEVTYATYAEKKPGKQFSFERDSDLCDAGAVLYQLPFEPIGSWSYCEFVRGVEMKVKK